MELLLILKAKKQKIYIDEEATVFDLQQKIATQINAELGMQKIIFKGATISKHPEKTLAQLKIKQGSKLMVINRENNIDEQKVFCKIGEVDKKVELIISKIEEILPQLDSVLKGFNSENSSKIFDSIKKNLTTTSENLMKQLELVDSIEVDASFQAARVRRKSLVVKINRCLDKCDHALEKIPTEE